MKKIALHSRPFEKKKLPFIEEIFSYLKRAGIPLYVSEPLDAHLRKTGFKYKADAVFSEPSDLNEVSLALSIGGDGTLLETVTFVRDSGVPILGINTGRLGFLATISRDKISESLDAVLNGFYTVEERTLLQLEIESDVFNGLNFALNEFTISKRDSASMIIVHTYIDGEHLNSYWADGLITATPTGSTGYSLSVGGPVVVPNSGNFIIAPVSPHNLNVRPLIVPDNSVISYEIEGRAKNFLVSLDSRSRKVVAGVQMAVRRCDFRVRLVRLNGEGFLRTLREKLNWGMDVRNYLDRY